MRGLLVSVLFMFLCIALILLADLQLNGSYCTSDISIKDKDLSSIFLTPGWFSSINKKISIDADFSNGRQVVYKIKLKGLDYKGIKVSLNTIIKARILKDNDGNITGFSGKLSANNIKFNDVELMPLEAAFKITKPQLTIYSLNIGSSYNLKGTVKLERPFQSELYLAIYKANIRDIAVLLKAKNPDSISGIVKGIFSLEGPFYNLVSKGNVEARAGNIGPIAYDYASLRLEGFGPIINILDSKVRQGQASFNMDGYIDVRDLSKGNLFEGIRFSADMRAIVWNGWDITKNNKDELDMIKKVGERMMVGFKTRGRDSVPSYYNYYNNKENHEEMSLEYKLQEKQSFKIRLNGDEEFFGIEHKAKF